MDFFPSDLMVPLRGALIGLGIAAPVGPIGLLCIQRTLERGRLNGFVSGLGAATADACLGLAAACGLSAAAGLLSAARPWIAAFGGAVLVWLGLGALRGRAAEAPAGAERPRASLLRDYLSVFGLTIINPMTVLAFAGIIAGLAAASAAPGPADGFWLVAGVFAGSASWWFLLSLAASRLRLGERLRRGINLASGLILIGFGAWMPLSAALESAALR
jgi:threonine/homoserine/homoserine lactone efflux protein